MMRTPARLRRFSQATEHKLAPASAFPRSKVFRTRKKDASRCCGLRHLLHDIPPLQLVPSGRKPLIAAESGMGLLSLRITAPPALGQVEILNVNISTSLGAYRRKAQRAKIVILEILGRLSRNDLCDKLKSVRWETTTWHPDRTRRCKDAPLSNDDIGLEHRLELFRLQVEIRDCEKRAHDLFFQNLIKGTSHLSIGQEAIAAGFGVAMQKGDKSFCTYRGHAHTLARGASMEGLLGELMLRDVGLYARQGRLDASDLGRT